MGALPGLDNTLGALLIGFGVSTMLYGMFFMQSLDYYRRYPSDKLGYKILITLLLALETVHQAFIGHSVYYFTITNYMNILVLVEKPIWSLVFQLLVGAVVGSMVKFLFTLRVWRFSGGNVWVVGILMLLNLGQLVLAIIFTAKSYALPVLPDLVNLRVLGTIALLVGVLNDIGIAISHYYYLQAIRASCTQSNSIIRQLTFYAVSTGVLISTTSFTTLLVYNFMPRNFIFVGCYFLLSKLYAISFIAALKTRQAHREQDAGNEPEKISSLQKGTPQVTRSFNIPLESPAVLGDSMDIESGVEEENSVSVPTSSTEDSECTQNLPRPAYTFGW